MAASLKICFVVLAHHQPRIFQKLLRNISWNESDVVVHIDKRADVRQFPDPGLANVHFMTARRKVNWAGWSLTRAIIEGLEHGLKVSEAGYFMYLAGTDFPIRPAEAILGFLGDRAPANFLNYYPLVPGIWGHGLISRYRFNDLKSAFIDPRNPQDRSIAPWRRLMGTLVTEAERLFNARYLPRDTNWTRFYSGSSRWCLNRETVRFIVDYYHSGESRKLRNYLRTCANSDEIFIQTAVFNSKFKDQCTGFDEIAADEIFAGRRPPMPDEKRVNLHYVDWSRERENPAILVEPDLQSLKQSGKFFACKFIDDRSLALAENIERELIKGRTDHDECQNAAIMVRDP